MPLFVQVTRTAQPGQPAVEHEKLNSLGRCLNALFASADALDALHQASIGDTGLPDEPVLRLLLVLNELFNGDGAQLRTDTMALAEVVGARIMVGSITKTPGKWEDA